MTPPSSEQNSMDLAASQISMDIVATQILAVKELMAANFKTIQVQLDSLGRMAPDVEILKKDMTDVKTTLAENRAHVMNLRQDIDHMDSDFMRRDELFETFVSKRAISDGKTLMVNKWLVGVGGSGVIVSFGLGLLSLVLGH